MPLTIAGSASILAVGDSGRTIVWDMAEGRIVRQIGGRERPSGAWRLTFSPRGDLLASVSGLQIHSWVFVSGQLVREYKASKETIDALAFTTDGRSLATAGRERRSAKTARNLESRFRAADCLVQGEGRLHSLAAAQGRAMTIAGHK